MLGSIDKSKGLLFCTYDLAGTIRNTQDTMRQEIERLDGNRLLNTAPADLACWCQCNRDQQCQSNIDQGLELAPIGTNCG